MGKSKMDLRPIVNLEVDADEDMIEVFVGGYREQSVHFDYIQLPTSLSDEEVVEWRTANPNWKRDGTETERVSRTTVKVKFIARYEDAKHFIEDTRACLGASVRWRMADQSGFWQLAYQEPAYWWRRPAHERFEREHELCDQVPAGAERDVAAPT
jgi:hypothetical protein